MVAATLAPESQVDLTSKVWPQRPMVGFCWDFVTRSLTVKRSSYQSKIQKR